jgi:hypothetical protein
LADRFGNNNACGLISGIGESREISVLISAESGESERLNPD